MGKKEGDNRLAVCRATRWLGMVNSQCYLGYLSAWKGWPVATCHGIPIGAVARRWRGEHNDHRGDRESGEDDESDVNGFFLQFEHKRSDRGRAWEGGREGEGHLYPDDAG